MEGVGSGSLEASDEQTYEQRGIEEIHGNLTFVYSIFVSIGKTYELEPNNVV